MKTLHEEPRTLLEQIANEVEYVEAELSRQVGSQVALADRIGRHTLEAGGKRLRPALLTLAARSVARPFDIQRARVLGACMEMIHMATLLHDDVIDGAAQRRGKPTAASEHGNQAAILTGDFLLAKAMSILAQDGDLEIIRCVAQMVVEMSQGEIREVELRGRFDVSADEHLAVLRMKTAAFIECCCEVGALLAKATPNQQGALKSFGHNVGMAFQIEDDVLDYSGSASETGKPRATDFREGCATLPLIYLLPDLSHDEREVAERSFGNGVTDNEIKSLVNLMRDRGAIDRAQATANVYSNEARTALGELPDTEARQLLASFAEFVVTRKS